jgi:hypothetical protein
MKSVWAVSSQHASAPLHQYLNMVFPQCLNMVFPQCPNIVFPQCPNIVFPECFSRGSSPTSGAKRHRYG